MRIDILTLFPDMVRAAFAESILARGIENGCFSVFFHQIRDYTDNKQGKVDDYPYGGGPGLILSYQPLRDAFAHVTEENQKAGYEKPYCIYMSPQGTPLTQAAAERLAGKHNLAIICGHYEGIDERVLDTIVDEEISIGDYVLTGGEIPAMALADCVCRLIPGVLACEEAYRTESHADGLLEYPQYTRPVIIDQMAVPEVLLSGNHAQIDAWRYEQALSRTAKKRPDLYQRYTEQKELEKTIYLDNSATTRQLPAVTAEMVRVSSRIYGNPSSLHHLGLTAEKELKACRETIAAGIGVSERNGAAGNIYFTSGGTESNNWALRGYLSANPRKGKHILVSSTEHPSVLETAVYLEKCGYEVQLIPVHADGKTNLSALQSMIRPDTALISVMHVNSETGAVQPIREISEIRRRMNPQTVLHTDAVQSFGKLPISAESMGVDLLSGSGHKIHGPRGVGFLYVRKGIKMDPLLIGGGQEAGLRSGTENLPAIAGFRVAAEQMCAEIEQHAAHVRRIRDRLAEIIRSQLHTYEMISDETCSPYIFCVAFPGLRGEVLLHSLEARGVFLSVGSACSSHKKNRSHVLTAMGYDVKAIDGAVRLSFSPYNTMEEAEAAGDALCAEVKKLRARNHRKYGKNGGKGE